MVAARGSRARAGDRTAADLHHAEKRKRSAILSTLIGAVLIGLGVAVFRISPEHGVIPAGLLIAFGGVMIDHRLLDVVRARGGSE